MEIITQLKVTINDAYDDLMQPIKIERLMEK
jgi:hypothetical protein